MPKGLTTGIIYIPLDVRWPRSKKVRAMIVGHGLDGMAAWYLYLAMACYCREGLTDGFVPAEEIGALAYPLAAEQATGLLKLLLDYRLVADSPGHGQGHSGGHDPGHSQGYSGGYLVRGYLKRNGTRAETEQLARKLAEQGRAGASRRWSDTQDGPGHSQGHSGGQWPPDAQTETESETTNARARTGPPPPARTRDGDWTPHSVLDHPPARKRSGPVTTHDTVAQVQAEARRPGGPSEELADRAADARKALANRPPAAPPTSSTDPGSIGRHGQDLARAQVAEARARRGPPPVPDQPEETDPADDDIPF
jgi:hypothetical protein